MSEPKDLSGLNWIRATDDPDPDAECIEIAAGEGDLVHLRQSGDPDNVVTTTQAKWDAFVLGVQNDEFDHFVADVDTGPDGMR
ncbi:DUF397 domain-containing protein [Streptomyces oceani]|uniref:DUF397 domain-containing protein n=1 Tax=Streptomyces oceani TaxID=1075402 RepID=A0A1E7KQ31_9ACTN|nr:DUF397 domain-containing protein [Streptomyces oceani]OEV06026.1 hypothetical protein AN216_00705 [Streptomyces oceani]